MNFEEIEKIVKEKLSEKRFHHSMCVVKRCEELAIRYGENVEKARLVGLVHDMAKEIPEEEKILYAEQNNLGIDDVERAKPSMLHGKIAGDMAKKQFSFTDDMVEAVAYHTTGKANMSMLDKILYIADATGDDRTWDDVQYVKDLADSDIDRALMYMFNLEIEDKLKEDKAIHVNTILARNYLILNQKY